MVVANRLRNNIEINARRNPLKKKVNFVKRVDLICTSDSEEDRVIDNCKEQRITLNEKKCKEDRDTVSEDDDRDPFKSNSSRLFKPGQFVRLRFSSTSCVVDGIEHGGLYYRRRRGCDWFRVDARCDSRISNRTTRNHVLRRRCVSFRKRNGRCDNKRPSILKVSQLKKLLRQRSGKESEEETVVEKSRKQNCGPSSSSVQITRKRRVGIVENQYITESDGGSSVCELVQGFERLFGEREAGNGVTMKSKKQQNVEESVVDPIEENETYDEFDTVRMPVVRSLSKSPQSDEGIETDSERRRGSMARCWSLDSAAASDEDTSLTTHQQKRHKLRVTRCCSSDSAVLSDEDQIKGEGDGIMPPVAFYTHDQRDREGERGDALLKTRFLTTRAVSMTSSFLSFFFSTRVVLLTRCIWSVCNGGTIKILQMHLQFIPVFTVTLNACNVRNKNFSILRKFCKIFAGWDSTNMVEGSESEQNEGRPRYWRTPSVVVSDYSDYSYLDEKLERNDLDLEKYDGTSGTPSQASSCSCLDCDDIRESLDNQYLQVCRRRRHSDSCCLCLDSMNAVAIKYLPLILSYIYLFALLLLLVRHNV